MGRTRLPLFLLLVSFLGTSALAASHPKKIDRKALSRAIEKVLKQPEADHAFWGVEVVSLDSGQEIYSSNSDKFFTPASTTKLFTTAAALALIGPDYRFRTTVEAAGKTDNSAMGAH